MVPSLTTLAELVPLKVRESPPAVRLLRFSVEATRPPMLTTAPFPKRMPFGLIRYTCPLALRWPKICVPLVSKILLIAMASAEGCRKSTVSCGAMLNVFQSSERFVLVWWMVVVRPDWEMVPAPEMICPPLGAACATGPESNTAAVRKLLPDGDLRRLRVVSATAIQASTVQLHIRR